MANDPEPTDAEILDMLGPDDGTVVYIQKSADPPASGWLVREGQPPREVGEDDS